MSNVLINNVEFEDWLGEGPDNLYFNYWNDPTKKDVYNIVEKDFKKLENFINEVGLYQDISEIINYLKKNNIELSGQGLDVAAGNLWTTAYFLKTLASIEKMICLEYSKHRIVNVGIKLLNYYNINKSKVKIIHGDFYDIKLPENTVDFVILCGVLHHASEPLRLLDQVYKVLKKGGLVIVVGDIFIKRIKYFKLLCKYIVLYGFFKIIPHKIYKSFFDKKIQKDFSLPFREIYFPTDNITGDHYHLKKDYYNFFKNRFFFREFKASKHDHLAFLLTKK